MISQREAALLANVALITIKRFDDQPAAGNLRVQRIINWIEQELKNGPHAYVRGHALDPVSLAPMPSHIRHNLKAGECFASLEYFEPSEIRMSVLRPDLVMKFHKYRGRRVIVLYRAIRSKYEREKLRKGYGVAVVDIRIPTFEPLSNYVEQPKEIHYNVVS